MPALEQTWNNLPEAKRFSLVYYFPIDATPKRGWVEDVVAKMQFPVAYTNYAKEECVKLCPSLSRMPVIYHGVNKKEFYPLNRAKAKKEFFAEHADKFIVTNVSRNQPRKDLIRTFAAFSVFHEQTPKSFLFVLAQAEDVGGNLIEMAENYGLVFGKDWACPSPKTYSANQGYDVETVNKIYNASDLIVSTTLGEGFGLSTVEAMATKTPILMPNNTALVEIIGKDQERGWFCESGLNLNFHVCLGANDNNLLRPVVDVYAMADQMIYICEHYEEAEVKAEAAFEWAQSWEEVCEDWIKIFKKAWTVPKKFKVQ
jgi:glycosyltransferase involved in cell wall biosynthesis